MRALLLFWLVMIGIVPGLPASARAQDTATPDVATTEGPATLDSDRVEQARLYLRDNPISPPDTTSPRATLESFVFIMREASLLWNSVRQDYENSNRIFLTEKQREKLVMITALLEKAAQTFDLSEIPVTSRERAGIEIALQLQEILDRIPAHDFSAIPGFPAGRFVHSAGSASLPDRWMLPSTSISILRQEAGEQRGNFLFSADSVGRIPDDYAVVSVLPLRADRGEDLFQYYIYTPGNLIAPHWYEYIEAGPNWLHGHFADQAYWQWLALLTLLAAYAACAGFFIRWRKWRAVSVDERTRVGHSILNPVLVILSAVVFRYLCEDHINITGAVLVAITTITTAVIWSATAWLVYHALQLIYLWFVRGPGTARQGLDASLLRTGFRVFSLAIALIVLGYGATQIGIPIYGVIAGLGVGGLAIALAAQPTIENLIGGVILYADRMVRVGEFCQCDELAGTIESIGIRSTRIRALDRTVITIANADLARRKIINFSERDQFHFRHIFGLRYDTEPENLKKILAAIRDYLTAHERVLADTTRVRMIGFNDYAVPVEAYAYVLAPDYSGFLEIQEQMLFDIRAIIETNGSGFAYPSSTVYLSRDSEMPAETIGRQTGKDRRVA
ncbi:mechanosensitive ion channel family protein [Labrenzia sp. OB1]|uniref:mechanosensitive ion channel family protein n=1 Tax=Labrenzia sp. OB1 TaxID=1561204 RepID=UPI000838F661|nr:mechanosensitive ion channel family protein [Labrenzia sp. OB1]